MADILTQDEIDALLGNVENEDLDDDDENENPHQQPPLEVVISLKILMFKLLFMILNDLIELVKSN